MIKRAAGMLAVSLALCGAIAAVSPAQKPQPLGSAEEEQAPMELIPTDDTVTYHMPEEILSVRETGLQEALLPAEDYEQIFPYPAALSGWKKSGTPVYRYAIADAAGEQLTVPCYTDAQRLVCGEGSVWLLTDTQGQQFCAAQDGGWVIGPIDGAVHAEGGYLFIRRSTSQNTEVYDAKGSFLHEIAGECMSCSDGTIVSKKPTENGDMWFLYRVDNIQKQAALDCMQVGAFSKGYASVQLAENTWGFVNLDGEVTPAEDIVWMDDVCEGYALAQNAEGLYGVLDVNGKTIASFTYPIGTHCGTEYPLYQLWKNDVDCIILSAERKQKLQLPEDLNGQRLKALPENYFAYTASEEGTEHTVIFDDLQQRALDGTAEFFRQENSLIAVQEDSYQIVSLADGKVSRTIAYRYVPTESTAVQTDAVFTIEKAQTGLQGIGSVRGKMILKPIYDSVASVGGDYYMAVQDGWSGIVDAHGTWIVRTRLSGIT